MATLSNKNKGVDAPEPTPPPATPPIIDEPLVVKDIDCSGRHKLRVPFRSVPHPAITMSKPRAEAWAKDADDKDFHEYLYALACIYAKRKYTGNGVVNTNLLFLDYKKWTEDRKKDILS